MHICSVNDCDNRVLLSYVAYVVLRIFNRINTRDICTILPPIIPTSSPISHPHPPLTPSTLYSTLHLPHTDTFFHTYIIHINLLYFCIKIAIYLNIHITISRYFLTLHNTCKYTHYTRKSRNKIMQIQSGKYTTPYVQIQYLNTR